jgi:hypothetical protein
MSEFTGITLVYVRAILKSIESSILLSTSSFTQFFIIMCSSSDMMIQNEIEKTEMTINNRSWSYSRKAASTMRILASPAAPCIKMNNEKIVMCLFYCLCHSAAP